MEEKGGKKREEKGVEERRSGRESENKSEIS